MKSFWISYDLIKGWNVVLKSSLFKSNIAEVSSEFHCYLLSFTVECVEAYH